MLLLKIILLHFYFFLQNFCHDVSIGICPFSLSISSANSSSVILYLTFSQQSWGGIKLQFLYVPYLKYRCLWLVYKGVSFFIPENLYLKSINALVLPCIWQLNVYSYYSFTFHRDGFLSNGCLIFIAAADCWAVSLFFLFPPPLCQLYPRKALASCSSWYLPDCRSEHCSCSMLPGCLALGDFGFWAGNGEKWILPWPNPNQKTRK